MNTKVEEALSLTVKLQAAEARAIAAEERALKSEYCLLKLRQYLDDHADVEDRPGTNEVRPNDYMCVLIAMDTMLIDTTAARELIDELERLRGEVAKAKTLGAVEELERYCLEYKAHFDALPGRLLNSPYFVNIENLQRRAAALRKKLS